MARRNSPPRRRCLQKTTLPARPRGAKRLFAECSQYGRDISSEPVEIDAYDPEWPARFEAERRLIEAAIGDRLDGGVHHVGSTAVPGLAAKPIIDILAGPPDLGAARRCIAPLRELRYVHFPYRPTEMVWLCKPQPERRTHHLHLVPSGSRRYREELRFRDRLRADADLAASYAELKRRLAATHRGDREAYTDAKGEFIADALAGHR